MNHNTGDRAPLTNRSRLYIPTTARSAPPHGESLHRLLSDPSLTSLQRRLIEMACAALRSAMRQPGVPRNCSAANWREEIQEVALLAAFEAPDRHDPGAGKSFESFTRFMVKDRIRTRYRQELGCCGLFVTCPFQFHDGGDEADGVPSTPTAAGEPEAPAQDPRLAEVGDAVAGLPPEERVLIEQAFWEGRPERQLAAALGRTQWFVQKLKRSAFEHLREALSP